MADCNRQTLMDAAACFNCLTEEDKATLKLQLLCDIKEESAGDVNSILAGAGISVSSPTGDVTIGNTGVLSLVAGNGISISAGTGNVTVSSTFSSTTNANTSITLTDSDHAKLLVLTAATAISIAAPASLRSDFFATIVQLAAGQATFAGSGGASVVNARSSLITFGQYAMVALTRMPSSNVFVLSGEVQ